MRLAIILCSALICTLRHRHSGCCAVPCSVLRSATCCFFAVYIHTLHAD